MQTLQLYRRILFAAKRFPSKNRLKVLEEIRSEFRRNVALAPADAEPLLKQAHADLQQLEAYSSLDQSSNSWVVDTTRDPMPRRE